MINFLVTELNMQTLIKNGRIITACDDYQADILIENETISCIGKNLDVKGCKVIDAKDKYIFPGGIDVHTHLDMPFGGTASSDDFESGTKAAAFGGTTTIVDFAIQFKGKSLIESLDEWHKKADKRACIDYSFHLIVTDLGLSQVKEMRQIIDREGVTSFKMFMAYPGVFYVDDGSIYRAMSLSSDTGALICMHAENGIVINEIINEHLKLGHTSPKYHAITRPVLAEAEGVNRAIAIAQMAKSPVYIVHLSCYEALKKVQEARNEGVMVYAETCPQYLFLDDEYYNQENFEGAKYVLTPPLRPKCHQDKLWHGLNYGDLQVISTDHCPFCFKEQKELGLNDFSKIPNGGPGVENRMNLIYNGGVVAGRISLNQFVQLTSTNPAKIFGMFPQKGTIAVGSDADLIIFDPTLKHTISAKTHHMKVDYNCYEGKEVTGCVETVLSRGEVIIQNGSYQGVIGRGNFIKRKVMTKYSMSQAQLI